MIYIIVFFLMLMAVYAFDLRGHKHFYSLTYLGFFIALVVIAGLRYRIGTDSIVYENDYEDFPKLWELNKFKFNLIRYEPGFIVFASLPRTLSSDFMLFQLFQAFVVNAVIFWFIYKNTTRRFLALTLYFIILYLNLCTQVLRESLAVAIFLLAWPFFRDGKWLQYYLLALLATLFHTSAFLILIFPVFALPIFRSIFKVGIRTVYICIGFFLLGLILQAAFKNFFSLLALNDRMVDRVNAYNSTNFVNGVLSPLGMCFTFIRLCLYPIVACYFLYQRKKYPDMEGSKLRKFKKRNGRFETLVLLGVYLSIISLTLSIFVRYYNYLGMFMIVAVSSWAFTKLNINGKKLKLNFGYWILILVPYFALNLNEYNASANKSGSLKSYMIYYPYYSRIEPQMDPNRESVYRYIGVR